MVSLAPKMAWQLRHMFHKHWCFWAAFLVVVCFCSALYGVDRMFEKRAYDRWERYSYQAMNSILKQGQTIDDKTAALKKLQASLPVNCSNDKKVVTESPIKHVSFSGFENNENCQDYLQYESVLVLTPARQIGTVVKRYFRNILSLSYPLCRVRIAIGVNDDDTDTFNLIHSYATSLAANFSGIDIYKLKSKNTDFASEGIDRHLVGLQFKRRRHLAQVRNMLLFAALKTETWVLWIDSDVRELPPDLLLKLLESRKDIIVPSCMYRKSPVELAVYDKNSWRETNTSYKSLNRLHVSDLNLEGYNQSKRLYLNDIQSEGPIVELDGVGGCCLLVKSEVHKKGIIFLPYLFKNHIETEGFAQAAKAVGYKLYGMPFVQVIH